MRVGFDGRWYNDSGVGTYVAELLKALIPLQTYGSPPQPGGPIGETGFDMVIYEDLRNPVPGLPKDSVQRVPIRTGKYSPAAQFELKRHCEGDRLDVFHSPFYPMPLRAPCPVVVTMHDLIPFLFKTGSSIKQLMVKRGYKVAARRSNQIIAVSRHTAEDIKRILGVSPQKLNVVHNGVSQEHFHPQRLPNDLEYLAGKGIRPPYAVVGSARNWQTKNLASALRALSAARSQCSGEFQTVVYGPADGLEAAGGAGAWKPLKLVQTGPLPAAGLSRLFRHAQLSIMPSLYEGFGLAVLEAMSCGCAVITSKGGSLPEVAGTGAQLFDPLDIEGMATAAATLLSNPIELKRWQEQALQRARDFSWSKAAEETVAVYHRAMGRSRSSK